MQTNDDNTESRTERRANRRTVLKTAAAVGTLGLLGTSTAAAATELIPDANGDATVTSSGHYTSSSTFRTVTVESSDVTLDGITFGGGASVAIKNGVSGLSNVTVTDCTFSGYSGRTITFGFAEGVSNATNRSSNIVLTGNYIGPMTGADATAVAIFDTDGVTVTENTIDRSSETNTGRRGINIDGDTDVVVKRNVIDLGASGNTGGAFGYPVFYAARWCVQLSMSNAPTTNVSVVDNTLVGAYDGMAVLSQRDLTGLEVHGTEFETVNGIRVNAGGTPPVGPTLTYEDMTLSGNQYDATRFTGGTTRGVLLQNTHAGSKDVTYRDVSITGNTGVGLSVIAEIQEDGITLENVKVRGNRAR